MKDDNDITLFIMPGCAVCPKMERIFKTMRAEGTIDGLQILDVTEHADLVKQHHIRSVPFYLINGVAFNGLKTRAEIDALLNQDSGQNWKDKIREELSQGQLDSIQQGVAQDDQARHAMLSLLDDEKTELVVRLGLTAIIETLAHSGVFAAHEKEFIGMTRHADQRIAIDALYYLHLIATPGSLQALENIALQGPTALRAEATELLAESLADQVTD